MTGTESADAANDLIIEDDEDPAFLAAGGAPPPPPWRVLIVDDDVDVHVVTKFALSNASFQGRRLSFLHAYGAREGLALLASTPDIALVLLDVIMETDDAGLRMARQIRAELHNELVRIVLRTGHPGQALEHSIIVDYDINDFWCKADLTTRKLFTTVISSLRAYASLAAAAHARAALNAELGRAREVLAAVDRHALVVTVDKDGKLIDANDKFCSFANARREQLVGRDVRAAWPALLGDGALQVLAHDGCWAGQLRAGAGRIAHCTVTACRDERGALCRYVALATVIDEG